jgi:hypothetical protein
MASTPAGWYPDPEVSGGQRYWDGSIWTEQRLAPSAAPPGPPTSTGALHEFESRVQGINATVRIFNDRIEWSQMKRLAVGKRRTHMMPIKSISSVSMAKDGLRSWKVVALASPESVDFRCSRSDAERAKDLLTSLLLR